MPLMVVVAFLLASVFGSSPDAGNQSGPLPTYTASAPANATQDAAPCNQLIDDLPVELVGLKPRVVTPNAGPYVLAWGNPAVVVRCGVAKPASVVPGDDKDFYTIVDKGTGPYYDVQQTGGQYVFTLVDRVAFVSMTIPTDYASKHGGATYIGVLDTAVLKAMPKEVCSTDSANPKVSPDQLCSHRS